MTLLGNQMRRASKTIFALGLPALAGFATACGDTLETPLASKELLEMRSDLVGYEVDTYVTKNGVRSAQIHADSAFSYEDSTIVHMMGVKMEIYTDQGAVRATVDAERGRYDPRTQGMHAEGNVVLVMPTEARRVESPELWYEPVDERIWSDSATTYRNKGEVTRGSCFKSDLSFKNYTVCNIRGAADVGGAG
jgi:LPS export ABC transporter protein LptC